MSGRPLVALVGVAVLSATLPACTRLTGLPDVPASVTAADAGLDSLPRLADEARRIGRRLDDTERVSFAAAPPQDVVDLVRWASDRIERGDEVEGLRVLAAALAQDPADLVVGNAYRTAVYRLKRKFLAQSKARGERTPELPEHLREEPLATLLRITGRSPGREIKLQVALAHVDRMVLNPALEIRAPASIDSVRILTSILEEAPHYVPALVGRGLNYLFRPRDLVWPEHPAPPRSAARRDLALAAAVGAKVGGAPPRLKGLLLVILGDACAHEGKEGLARSWWALARETSPSPEVRGAIDLRMRWPDRETPDRLEEHLEERMEDVDSPVSDLSFLWSDGAPGPS